MYIRDILCFSNLEEKIVAALILLFPVFFLTIKGWTNGISILMLLVSISVFFANIKFYFFERGRRIWFVVAIFFLPLLCEITVQLLRYSIYSIPFHAASIDTVLRPAAAGLFFLFLSRYPHQDFFRCLYTGCIFGGIVALINEILFSGHWLGSGRASSYFIDPNTFGVYSVALGTLAYLGLVCEKTRSTNLIKILSLTITLYLAFMSESRSALLAAFILGLFIVIVDLRKKISLTIIASGYFIFVAAILLVFAYADVWRVGEILPEVNYYLNEAVPKETSIGSRIDLLILDFKMIQLSPFLGWVDGSTPAPEVLTRIMPNIAPDTQHIKIYSGSHVELLNWIVKQGVFGFISIFSIFLFPLYKGITFLRKNEGKHFGAKLALVALPLIIFISGLGVQTLNLKMSITFYSFSIATILAVLVGWRGAVKSPCPTMGTPKINGSHGIR